MKLGSYLKNVTGKDVLRNVGMKFKQSKPELMLFGGGIFTLGATIWAVMKAEEGKEKAKEFQEAIEIARQETEIEAPEGVTVLPEAVKQMKLERGKRYTKIYAHTAYELLKVFGGPAALWFAGMGLIFGAHGELRKTNASLVAEALSVRNLMQEYRERVAKAVGEEVEQRIFMGAEQGTVHILETDPDTGEQKIKKEKGDVFYAQPGSIFARNFTEETSDAFDIRSFADIYLEDRINTINQKLAVGVARAYTGMDILRMLGYNENALGEDENIDALIRNGISGNARKVKDPEMRKLKVTRLQGYQKVWDVERNMEVYKPCLRLDFNFYPLEGMI